jgi:hypothetical protein
MYIREIMPPQDSPIVDGKPVYGTWNRAFKEVNLTKIKQPFRFKIPVWAKYCRIKEWEQFIVQDDNISLEAILCNVKLYRMVQVLLFNKKESKLFDFRKILPGVGRHNSGWRLSQSLANSSLDHHSSRFFFRIHNWLDADTIRLDLDISATKRNPSLTTHLAFNMSRRDSAPMAVSLDINALRNMYAFKSLAPVRGDLVFDGQRIKLKQNVCSGIFCDYKGYYPYRMHMTTCSGMGFDTENRRFGFHIAENQTKETYKNNENALWVNDCLTPLPPVRITMPQGPDSEWIIQDVEGMVDLTFSPKEPNRSEAALLFTSVVFNAYMGYFNGMLVSAQGEQIQVRNVFGMGEKLYLRV